MGNRHMGFQVPSQLQDRGSSSLGCEIGDLDSQVRGFWCHHWPSTKQESRLALALTIVLCGSSFSQVPLVRQINWMLSVQAVERQVWLYMSVTLWKWKGLQLWCGPDVQMKAPVCMIIPQRYLCCLTVKILQTPGSPFSMSCNSGRLYEKKTFQTHQLSFWWPPSSCRIAGLSNGFRDLPLLPLVGRCLDAGHFAARCLSPREWGSVGRKQRGWAHSKIVKSAIFK